MEGVVTGLREWLHIPAGLTCGSTAVTAPLSLASGALAHGEIAACPHYQVTPLHRLADIACEAAVADVAYKDEAGRFGLGSFKALGGAYAVAQVLQAELGHALRRPVTIRELVNGDHREHTRRWKVICASDGNHGRSVAAGAQLFGCRCDIYLHAGVSEGRASAIRHYGAQVVRTPGDYDGSVLAAAAAAREVDCILVSDTAADPSERVPAMVLQGYSILLREAFDQLAPELPSHIFIQAGVGGLAAAVVAHVQEAFGADAPLCVIVEPRRADCLFQSARAGRPQSATGDLDTLMAGLACGEPSAVAWPILAHGAAAFMLVDDEEAILAMRRLADRDEPIVAGESAVAGLSGLLKAASNQGARDALHLNAQSRVLLIGTEGATDPDLYARYVGRTAADVAAGVGRP